MRRFTAVAAGLLLTIAHVMEQAASPETVACYLEACKALGDLTETDCGDATIETGSGDAAAEADFVDSRPQSASICAQDLTPAHFRYQDTSEAAWGNPLISTKPACATTDTLTAPHKDVEEIKLPRIHPWRPYMGVYWCDSIDRWACRIWATIAEKEVLHEHFECPEAPSSSAHKESPAEARNHQVLGYFDTAEEAAQVYDRAACLLHGDDVYTNFPRSGSPQEPVLAMFPITSPGRSQDVPVSVTKPATGRRLGGSGTHSSSEEEPVQKFVPVHPPTTIITKPVPGKGSSPYRGVSWHRHNFKWRATIFKGTKPVHIGYFEHEWEAAKAYDVEAIRLRGANTVLNFSAVNYGLIADPFGPPVSSWARKKKAPAASTPNKAPPQPARAKRARRGSPAEQPSPGGGYRRVTRSATAAELAGIASNDAADALAALSVAVTHVACTQESTGSHSTTASFGGNMKTMPGPALPPWGGKGMRKLPTGATCTISCNSMK